MTYEDTFSRKNIHNWVLKELEEDLELLSFIEDTQKRVRGWTYATKAMTYPSKSKRLEKLLEEDLDALVLDIFIEVCLQGYASYQAVAGKIGAKINMPVFDAVKTVAEIMAIMCECDAFDVIVADDSDTGVMMVESHYELPETIKQKIADTMYLPPMVCKPFNVTDNYTYHSMTEQGSLILGKSVNHHNMPLAYDAINIASGIALSLDAYILGFKEVPNKELDTQEKVDSFNRMQIASTKVYHFLLENGNKWYLRWRYDKRGRMYSQG